MHVHAELWQTAISGNDVLIRLEGTDPQCASKGTRGKGTDEKMSFARHQLSHLWKELLRCQIREPKQQRDRRQ